MLESACSQELYVVINIGDLHDRFPMDDRTRLGLLGRPLTTSGRAPPRTTS